MPFDPGRDDLPTLIHWYLSPGVGVCEINFFANVS